VSTNLFCEVNDGLRTVFTAELTGLVGGRAHLRFSGELDVASAGALRPALTRLQQDGVTRLTIDASDLEFMDSMGLSVMIGAMSLFDGPDPIHLVDPSPQVSLLLETTGVGALFGGLSGD
jgi:anti-sigma B factor antagonist